MPPALLEEAAAVAPVAPAEELLQRFRPDDCVCVCVRFETWNVERSEEGRERELAQMLRYASAAVVSHHRQAFAVGMKRSGATEGSPTTNRMSNNTTTRAIDDTCSQSIKYSVSHGQGECW